MVTAALAMALMTTGLGLGTALVMVDLMTWAMAHGHGLASFIRNPAAATGSYLANVTAGQLAWDLLDFALTFVPGSVLGAGGHAIARTTATDMATNRTAMRQAAERPPKPPNTQQPKPKPDQPPQAVEAPLQRETEDTVAAESHAPEVRSPTFRACEDAPPKIFSISFRMIGLLVRPRKNPMGLKLRTLMFEGK